MKYRTYTHSWNKIGLCLLLFGALIEPIWGTHFKEVCILLVIFFLKFIRDRNKGWITIDDKMVVLDEKILIEWEEVDSFIGKKFGAQVFRMKNGEKRKISTYDWPEASVILLNAIVRSKFCSN